MPRPRWPSSAEVAGLHPRIHAQAPGMGLWSQALPKLRALGLGFRVLILVNFGIYRVYGDLPKDICPKP